MWLQPARQVNAIVWLNHTLSGATIVRSRKRVWLLLLLTPVVVTGLSMWWIASAKSEFERRCDRIQRGTKLQDAIAVMQPKRAAVEEWLFPGRTLAHVTG